MRREEQLDNLINEIRDLKEDLERARTYTGLEAQGCPLCTYIEGVFMAACSFHRQIEAMRLVIEAAKVWKGREKWPYLACSELAQALDVYEERASRCMCPETKLKGGELARCEWCETNTPK